MSTPSIEWVRKELQKTTDELNKPIQRQYHTQTVEEMMKKDMIRRIELYRYMEVMEILHKDLVTQFESGKVETPIKNKNHNPLASIDLPPEHINQTRCQQPEPKNNRLKSLTYQKEKILRNISDIESRLIIIENEYLELMIDTPKWSSFKGRIDRSKDCLFKVKEYLRDIETIDPSYFRSSVKKDDIKNEMTEEVVKEVERSFVKP